VLAEKKPYFRACGGGRPAVRQFPDPRAQPFLNLWKEHKRCSGEKGRHQDSEKKGTSAKSRLLRIATRGWIDRLGLVSWLLRLALRQLLHRPSPHISALQSIQETSGRLSQLCPACFTSRKTWLTTSVKVPLDIKRNARISVKMLLGQPIQFM
jgi:hypothetical protein